MTKFSGIWVPLVTPFDGGDVDYMAAQRLAMHLSDHGVQGLIVGGTTGESTSLNHTEKTRLLEAVLDAVHGHCPVLMGLSGSSTREVTIDARSFTNSGIAGYLLSAPAYVRPSQEGILAHFQHVAKATDLPIVIYNIPARTGVNMEVSTIAALCASDQFVAVKECSGLTQMETLISHASVPILCGEDALMLSALAHGGTGAIAASAHLYPELFVAMVNHAQDGDFEAARTIFHKLQPLIQILFSEPNPAPVKAALAMQGWIKDELRLPMLPASEACKARLRNVLDHLDALKATGNWCCCASAMLPGRVA